jgi:hypothetical protein
LVRLLLISLILNNIQICECQGLLFPGPQSDIIPNKAGRTVGRSQAKHQPLNWLL